MVIFICSYCKNQSETTKGAYNRAKKYETNLYCDRVCSGYGRRKNKTAEQRIEEKRIYDMQYREKNRDMLKIKKSEYYKRTRDPAKEAERRKLNMHRHVEYCRKPEYKAKKYIYDQKRYAKEAFGDYWESHILAFNIRREVLKQMSDYEIRVTNGTINKCLERKRKNER